MVGDRIEARNKYGVAALKRYLECIVQALPSF